MIEHIAIIVLLLSLILGAFILPSLLVTLVTYCFGKAWENTIVGVQVGFMRRDNAVAVAVTW
jgi:hypothetical protein